MMVFRHLLLILFALLLSGVTTQAQIIQIHTEEGTRSFDLAEVDSITFSEADGEPEAGEERDFQLTDDVTITMCWIPAGSFMMGRQDNEQDSFDNEDPRHEVNIGYGFWMGKYEVTQAQWEAVTGSNPSGFDGDNRPVEQVSWNNIHDDFLSQIDEDFRLPSESEWEYACRAGTDTRFYWGDDPDYDEIGDYAWYSSNSNSQTHDVGQKNHNAWGLLDMSGNVYEWCEDWYHDSYESAPDDGGAWVAGGGWSRVLRGGCWDINHIYCRSADRFWFDPTFRDISFGFRLVLVR
jgi:formylglycine-generating enzyme required for sulfatase activity